MAYWLFLGQLCALRHQLVHVSKQCVESRPEIYSAPEIHRCCFSTPSADHPDCKSQSKSIRQSHNGDCEKINGCKQAIVRKHEHTGELSICEQSVRAKQHMFNCEGTLFNIFHDI